MEPQADARTSDSPPNEITASSEAVELGEFSPPEGFDHGPEFLPEIPRAVPPRARLGSYGRRRRGTVYILLMVGAACVLLAYVPFVAELGYYILPLQYLHYIGAGLIVIGIWTYLSHCLSDGLFTYIRYGVPNVGRVRQIGVGLCGTAEMPQFQYVAEIEHVHPETGRLERVVLNTDVISGQGDLQKFSPGAAVGDYVTLVSLREKHSDALQPGSMKLYGWLGLDPDRDFIQKNGKPLGPVSPLMVFFIIFAIVSVLMLLLSFIYIIEFCSPIDGDWKVGIVPAVLGILAGLAVGWLIVRRPRTSEQSPQSTAGETWGVMLSFPFLGVFASVVLLFLLNARLDTSPPDYRPVEIENYWQTTHNFIIRNYNIEYREFAAAKTSKYPARVDFMEEFRQSNLGIIDIGRGRFGLTWVRGLHPLKWIEKPADVPEEAPGVTLTIGTPAKERRFIPVIELTNGQIVKPPQPLTDRAIAQFKQEMQRFAGAAQIK